MTPLFEYFENDKYGQIIRESFNFQSIAIVGRVHFDHTSNAKYVSFYIPNLPNTVPAIEHAINQIPRILDWPPFAFAFLDDETPNDDAHGEKLRFTGLVYLYSESPIPEEQKSELTAKAEEFGLLLVFRSTEYVERRNSIDTPKAFICHDSRDKTKIATPLAHALLQKSCPVWYDEFSLRGGDNLRESIERGLKGCSKCILILTPNFLANEGWSKTEYDSIFTREIAENRKLIVPIWHQVSAQDVYDYSAPLGNRYGIKWSLGVIEVRRQILLTIDDRKW